MTFGYTRLQRQMLFGVMALLTLVFWSDRHFGWSANTTLPGAERAALRLRLAARAQDAIKFGAPPESFAFNPNTVTAEELVRLGLRARQVSGWLRYRGDRPYAFRKPEDIGKLYGLSKEEKVRLIPLAYVPDSSTAKRKRRRPEGFAFDPNSVTPAELERLGLSFKQALALVNYRSKTKYPPAFRKPADLARVKTMSAEQRAHLLQWAVFPEKVEQTVVAGQRFRFDPNTISADSFALLGFPDWQANSLVKYRGGRAITFRRATDLWRVKSLDSNLVAAVIDLIDLSPAPSISFAPAAAPSTYSYAPKLPPPVDGLDVNTADTSAWKSLPGIGSYRARTIVRFRDKLGGFATPEQVGETRRLPDSIFQLILPYLKVETPLRPIAINHATYTELNSHPYISRSLANLIVKNREQRGPFREPADLRRLRLLKPDKIKQLTPYFSFE